jgi:RimJ/RimL family protein N-acetyltransferase
MEFRKLTEADAEAWRILRLEAVENAPLAFGETVEEVRAAGIEELADRIREKPDGGFMLGGFVDERLIAMAGFQRESRIKERHKGHLRTVYLSAGHRGRGLGMTLIAKLIELATQDGSVEQIHLAVGAHNSNAIRAYRRLGFEFYGTEPHALKVENEYVDEHLMVLWVRTRRS